MDKEKKARKKVPRLVSEKIGRRDYRKLLGKLKDYDHALPCEIAPDTRNFYFAALMP